MHLRQTQNYFDRYSCSAKLLQLDLLIPQDQIETRILRLQRHANHLDYLPLEFQHSQNRSKWVFGFFGPADA